MSWLARFWNQENKAYRNFQIVYTILTLNFFIPALGYYFAPDASWASFRALGTLLGSPEYIYPENSQYWRILGAGNVMTLAFMCFLLQVSLTRFYPILPALVFLKACSAFGFLGVYLWVYKYSLFLAAFLFDGVTMLAMLYFAISAHRALDDRSAMFLFPEPLGSRA